MVLSLSRQGEHIEKKKNGAWMVQLGMMTVTIKEEALE